MLNNTKKITINAKPKLLEAIRTKHYSYRTEQTYIHRAKQFILFHIFRHSFATHFLEASYNIQTVPELLGHKNVNTTMIYTQVLTKGGKGVKSPVDF